MDSGTPDAGSDFQRTCPGIPKPKPLRCGESGFEDLVRGFSSPSAGGNPAAGFGWPPTLPTAAAPVYSMERGSRSRLPCEHFRDVLASAPSEFQDNARVSTSNLIDLQTKESWNSTRMRSGVYGQCPVRCVAGGFGSQEDCEDALRGKLDDCGKFTSGWAVPSYEPCEICLQYCRKCCTPTPFYPEAKTADSGFPNGDPTLDFSNEGCDPNVLLGSSSRSPQGFLPFASAALNTVNSQTSALCGERVFKCDFAECPKSFTRKEELTRHKRTHSNERAFECEICLRKFIRKDHMTKHLATHEDVSKRRRYVCKEKGCSRRYTRSDALSRHRAAAHPIMNSLVHY